MNREEEVGFDGVRDITAAEQRYLASGFVDERDGNTRLLTKIVGNQSRHAPVECVFHRAGRAHRAGSSGRVANIYRNAQRPRRPLLLLRSRERDDELSEEESEGNSEQHGESRDPNGIRTRVTAVKGRCPRPLDDRVRKAGAISEARRSVASHLRGSGSGAVLRFQREQQLGGPLSRAPVRREDPPGVAHEPAARVRTAEQLRGGAAE